MNTVTVLPYTQWNPQQLKEENYGYTQNIDKPQIRYVK